ncbi:WD40 repeat domain-containing protein [Halomonadaceae bacterium KBTZ08]
MSFRVPVLVWLALCAFYAQALQAEASDLLSEKTIENLPSWPDELHWSSNGRYLLLDHSYNQLVVLDAEEEYKRIELGFEGQSIGAGWALDQTLFLASGDGTAKLWNPPFQETAFHYQFPQGCNGEKAVINEQASYIGFGSCLLHIRSETLTDTFKGKSHAVQSGIGLVGADYMFTSGFHDRQLRLWDIQKGTLQSWQIKDQIAAADISFDGNYLALGARAGWLDFSFSEIVLFQTGQSEQVTSVYTFESPNTVRFIPKTELLAALTGDSTITVYRVPDLGEKATFHVAPGESVVTALDVSEQYIAAGDQNGNLGIWGVAGSTLSVQAKVCSDGVQSVSIHPVEPKLAVGCRSDKVYIVSVR